MTSKDLLVLGGAELVALVFIIRLWLKRRHKRVWARVAWSLVLLIPILGVIGYGLVTTNPDEHSYDNHPNSGIDGHGDH